jgi:nitroreductase
MTYSRPAADIIRERFSCRTFLARPIAGDARQRLAAVVESTRDSPFGSGIRFQLVAATLEHGDELKGLGTYGFIKDPAAFIVGAGTDGEKLLEDYGHAMERLLLAAADLGLGTCWLGGFFTRSSFSRAIGIRAGERVPAVVAVGMVADMARAKDGFIRRLARGDRRLPWERLFYDGSAEMPLAPLARDAAGPYAAPLEMVRIGPSASNRQPWRIVRDRAAWHFFRRGGHAVQRMDLGIAMCHFELAARELGLPGSWVAWERLPAAPEPDWEYTATWKEMR